MGSRPWCRRSGQPRPALRKTSASPDTWIPCCPYGTLPQRSVEDGRTSKKAVAMPGDPPETVRRFAAAFTRHDLSALGELITEDCVFESTRPPDGERIVGRAAVLE